MKIAFPLLLFVLAAGGCSESPDTQAEVGRQDPAVPSQVSPADGSSTTTEKAAAGEGPEWAAPVHINLEVYVNKYVQSQSAGATTRPDLSLWRPSARGSFKTSSGDSAERMYSVNLEYEGTQDGKDYYLATVTHPTESGSASFTRNLVYVGTDIEIWKDSQWRVGVRPLTDNSGS